LIKLKLMMERAILIRKKIQVVQVALNKRIDRIDQLIKWKKTKIEEKINENKIIHNNNLNINKIRDTIVEIDKMRIIFKIKIEK
jgi:hypothetical protein